VFNLETNTVVESYDVTFNKTASCPHDVFESTGDNEIEESIFVDKELHPSMSSSELVPTSTLEAVAPQATTSSTTAVEASQLEWEIFFEQGAPYHVQKAHPPQQIIGNLNERVT
jgi:hypothetical protein